MDISRPTSGARIESAVRNNPTGRVAEPVGSSTLDYSAFLKLLVAQMQNQDPLEPMKSSDYVAQLATFSQVEKTVELNTRMAGLLTTVQLQQAGSLIGQRVTSADGSVSGTVASTSVGNGGVVAVLTDGREVAVGSGVKLGGPA